MSDLASKSNDAKKIPQETVQDFDQPQAEISNFPAPKIRRGKLDPKLLTPTNILSLQRTIGNQATRRLLKSKSVSTQPAVPSTSPLANQSITTIEPLPKPEPKLISKAVSQPFHRQSQLIQRLPVKITGQPDFPGPDVLYNFLRQYNNPLLSVDLETLRRWWYDPLRHDHNSVQELIVSLTQARSMTFENYLHNLLTSMGVAPSEGDFIKILNHAIRNYDVTELEEAKKYVASMAARFGQLTNSTQTFEHSGHPRASLMQTMNNASSFDPQSFYNMYRRNFEPVPPQQQMPPEQFFQTLNNQANSSQQQFRFAVQGREQESYRTHFQNAFGNSTAPSQSHPQQNSSRQLLEQAQAFRVLPRNETSLPTLARLTLTIHPRRLEHVFRALTYLAQKYPDVVINFKVMGINNIGAGPDDIVIYLSKLITSQEVRLLVAELIQQARNCFDQTGHYFLREGRPPLGMQELATGVYGADMPSDPTIVKKGQGSHGMNISLLLSQTHTTQQQQGSNPDSAFASTFASGGLNPYNPAFSQRLVYDGRTFRLGSAAPTDMTCFIDAIVQTTGQNRGLVQTIAQNLQQANMRVAGEPITTHEDVMNAIIAQIEHDVHITLRVRVIFQNPFTGQLGHMDVGNGALTVYIYYSHNHYDPLF